MYAPDFRVRASTLIGVAGSPRTHAGCFAGVPGRGAFERRVDRITQGSVQIELIFRLLLKITVDWPFHAISRFLKPSAAPRSKNK